MKALRAACGRLARDIKKTDGGDRHQVLAPFDAGQIGPLKAPNREKVIAYLFVITTTQLKL